MKAKCAVHLSGRGSRLVTAMVGGSNLMCGKAFGDEADSLSC